MTDLEVDSASKSLVASWFGLQTGEAKQEINELSDECVKKKKRNHKDLKDKDGKNRLPKHNEKETKSSLGNFIEEKLNKKLKKSKQRKEEATREALTELQGSNDNTHKKKKRKQKTADDPVEEEEVSKVSSVLQKANKTEVETVQTYTIESLKSCLADNTLSKAKRKRLKRKLNTLLEKESGSPTPKKRETVEETNSDTEDRQLGLSDEKMTLSPTNKTFEKGNIDSHCHKKKRKRDHDTSTSLSDSNHKKMSLHAKGDVNSQESNKRLKNSDGNSSSESEREEKTEEKLKVPFSVRNENDLSTKTNRKEIQEPDSNFIPKRKRKKVRSKQKNIKKDNRPDHLKPAHLRKKTKDEATDEKDN